MSFSPLALTQFVFPNGAPVALGWFTIRLSKDAVSPQGQVSTRQIEVELDSNGVPVGGPVFWPNSLLLPNDTCYILTVFNAQGERIMGPQMVFVGPSTGGLGFGQALGSSFGS